MAATKSPFQLVAYDPEDDPYAMSESEARKPQSDAVIKQSFPQMDIEPKVASTETENKSEAKTAVRPSEDPLKYTGPEKEAGTPPTTLPEAETPHEDPPRPAIKHRAKLKRRGAEPLSPSSCKCCLM